MLSKILSIATMTVGIQATAENFSEFYKIMVCNIANQNSAADALSAYYELQEAINEGLPIYARGLSDTLHNPDQDILWEDAKSDCASFMSSGPVGPGSDSRTVNSFALSNIHGGYGCWGNFPTIAEAVASSSSYASLIAEGRGAPKDELDRAARDLTQAYKCIMEEYIAETNGASTCNPWEQDYSGTVQATIGSTPTLPSALTTIQVQCNTLAATHGSCMTKACLVESYFLARYIVWSYSFTGFVPNDETTYFHSTAGYALPYNGSGVVFVNNAANCPPQGLSTHVYCCGEYPFRKRVHSINHNDQCCDGNVYDDTVSKCCGDTYYMGGDDGVVTPIGDAC